MTNYPKTRIRCRICGREGKYTSFTNIKKIRGAFGRVWKVGVCRNTEACMTRNKPNDPNDFSSNPSCD